MPKQRGVNPGRGEPAQWGESVTASDTADLEYYARGLWVGGAGDVAVTLAGGDKVTFVGVQAGTLLPIRVTRVWSTDTTATDMVALH